MTTTVNALSQIVVAAGVTASVSAKGKDGKFTSLIFNPDGYAGMHVGSETVSYLLQIGFERPEGLDESNHIFFFVKRGDGTIRVVNGTKWQNEVHFKSSAEVVRGSNRSHLNPEENHIYCCMAGPAFGGVMVMCVALILRHGESLCVLHSMPYTSVPRFRAKKGGDRVVRFPEIEMIKHGALQQLADQLRMRKVWDANDKSLEEVTDDWRKPEPDLSILGENQGVIVLSSVRQDQYVARLGNGQDCTIRGNSMKRAGAFSPGEVVHIPVISPNTSGKSRVPFFGSGEVTVIKTVQLG